MEALRQIVWPKVPDYEQDVVNKFDPWQFATYLDVRAQIRERRAWTIAAIILMAVIVNFLPIIF